MKLSEFKIGMEFEMSGQRWRCTDIGTRTVAAICLDDIPQNDPSWLNGPPYAVVENVIDEYDRPAFYRAIQNVREQNMDLTGWLEYFTRGLATQLLEVKDRGQRVIQTDLMAKKHGLTDRQQVLVGFLLEHGEAYFADLESACPDVPRRTLQRDIQGLVNTGILEAKGATNLLRYTLKEKLL